MCFSVYCDVFLVRLHSGGQSSNQINKTVNPIRDLDIQLQRSAALFLLALTALASDWPLGDPAQAQRPWQSLWWACLSLCPPCDAALHLLRLSSLMMSRSNSSRYHCCHLWKENNTNFRRILRYFDESARHYSSITFAVKILMALMVL